jgi:large subunit ribosomal protein L31
VKDAIHPNYHTTEIVCGTCGATWKIGSTRQRMRVSICSNCHPFYTGEQRKIVDTEGQVDRFMKRLAVSQERQANEAKRREGKKEKPKKKSLLKEIYGEEESSEAEEPAG